MSQTTAAPTISLLTGKLEGQLNWIQPTNSDQQLFDEFWNTLVGYLGTFDAEMAQRWQNNYDLYVAALGYAKGYFSGKNFGGMLATAGSFGVIVIRPQDFANGLPAAKQFDTWVKQFTSNGWNNLFGDSTNAIVTNTTLEQRTLFAFHDLLSWYPNPQVQQVRFTINGYTYYVPWVTEFFSNIEKPFKQHKVIPLPGRIVIHPGGKFYIRAAIENANAITNIRPEGLCFAEFDYLNQEFWW